jgi:N-acetylneuraminate synthase/N,N'-diacetyllegionaminate synthase
MRGLRIERRVINRGRPAYILAEIGINHEGDINLAKEMIDAAAECGADGVKFQSFRAGDLVDKDASPDYYELFKRVELSRKEHEKLFAYCGDKGLNFLSTPFDNSMVDMLIGLGVGAMKVASGDLTHLPMLRHIGSKGVPVILSTGMSFLSEVDEARRALYESGCPGMVLLHCVSRYPAKPGDLNLRSMVKLGEVFNELYGFSDHSVGYLAAVTAAAMGANFIEKHFTLDKNLPGPDHKLSADPEEMKALVDGVRYVEKALGRGTKEPIEEELRDRHLGRRGCYAAKDIKRGEKLTSSKVKFTSPEGVIPAKLWERIEGRKTSKAVKKGKPIDWGMLE